MRLARRYLHVAVFAATLDMTLGFAAIPPTADAFSADPLGCYPDSYDCGFTQVLPEADLSPGPHCIDVCGVGKDGTVS